MPAPAAQPLRLTDEQITCIMQLSRPLLPDQRVVFVELLVSKLNGHCEVGDGQLHRLCAEIQRQLFDPPLSTHVGTPQHVRKTKATAPT
jgi:hypothetical protein